ncbi:phosphotransferase family protein [Roseivivax sp. CAU 1753]
MTRTPPRKDRAILEPDNLACPEPEAWLIELCNAVFDAQPTTIDYPGGVRRKTCLIEIGGERFAVARRKSVGRARLEAAALHHLAPTGAVPEVVAVRGETVVQRAVAGQRLSESLDRADPMEAADMARKAIRSIGDFQACAGETELSRLAPRIGERPGWLEALVATPQRVADRLSLRRPDYDMERLVKILAPTQWAFIKWDARPGNAIVTPGGSICWIDWEHCGRRRAVDDAAWLLADEWCPHIPGMLAHAAESLEDSSRDVYAALIAMAVIHSFIRMELILRRKASGPWWCHSACLKHDRVGVTPDHMVLVADRAMRWSAESVELRPLVDLCHAIVREVSLDSAR